MFIQCSLKLSCFVHRLEKRKGFPLTDDPVIASGFPSMLSVLAYTMPWAKPCVKARTSLILLQKCGSGVLFSYYFFFLFQDKQGAILRTMVHRLVSLLVTCSPFPIDTHAPKFSEGLFLLLLLLYGSSPWNALERLTSGGIPSLTRYSVRATYVWLSQILHLLA